MKLMTFLLVALTQIAAATHQPKAIAPEIVVVPSGALQLKALLWLPENGGPFPAVLFNHGSGSSDAMHTGPFVITEAAERLGPIFVKHGYAFLYLFRRGQGLSADQGDFMQELLQREKMANGEEALKSLQFRLLTTDHLDDVIAGLSFLKELPRVDANRIAIAGHSFGGQLTLLAAERDNSVRAEVHFWSSRCLMERLAGASRAFIKCSPQDKRSVDAHPRGERLLDRSGQRDGGRAQAN